MIKHIKTVSDVLIESCSNLQVMYLTKLIFLNTYL